MRWNMPRFIGLVFLSVFEVAGAAPIVYNVNVSGNDSSSTFTLVGSITVADGKFGLLASTDIIAAFLSGWGGEIAFSGDFLPPSCSAGLTCGFFATPTQLMFTDVEGRSMSFTFLASGGTFSVEHHLTFSPDGITGSARFCDLVSCSDQSGVIHISAPYIVGTVVPEPATTALVGIGLVWLGFVWKRARATFQ